MSPINYGPSDINNPRGVPFGGMVPESYWLTKALLFDYDWIVRDAHNHHYNKNDFPEETPSAALKFCFRLLRGFEVRIVLTSNRKQSHVVEDLHRMNLAEDFDNIRCFEDVTELKPKTELHLLALDMMGVKPVRAIALETDPFGVQAAKAAGLFCIGTPELAGKADMTLDSFIQRPLIHTLENIDRHKRANLGMYQGFRHIETKS